jgi:AGZA family xanthine/uracil permease-like MFS transporter
VTDDTTRTARPAKTTGLDAFFKITERGSTVAREVGGGVVTF